MTARVPSPEPPWAEIVTKLDIIAEVLKDILAVVRPVYVRSPAPRDERPSSSDDVFELPEDLA
jgi:hypothetical protein